jgi:pilus assembly protein CpaE
MASAVLRNVLRCKAPRLLGWPVPPQPQAVALERWTIGKGEAMSTGETPAILLFLANPALDPLENALQARGLAAMRVRSLEDGRRLLAARRQNSIAVLDTYHPAPFSFAAVYRLLHEPPAVPTLLLLHERAGQAPPVEALPPSDDYARLPARIDELVLRVQALLVRAGLPVTGETAAGQATLAREAPRFHHGQVIAVYGPKGGVGRSTIAVNLAVGLARFYGQQVVLLDADLWFGDVPVLLDLQSEKSLISLVDSAEHLDLDALREVLVPHASGVHVLFGAPEASLVETIPPSLPSRVASAYRTLFDFVVVDTHPSMEEYMVQLLETADRILLVTTPELSAIRSTSEVLRLAGQLGWAHKLLLVLNRANSGVRVEQIERTLGMKVDATVVSAGPRVVDAANRGQPVLQTDTAGKEPITRDLARLVARVASAPEPTLTEGAPAARRPLWRLK